jgi:integrase
MQFNENTLKGVTKIGKRYMLTDSTRTGLVLRVSVMGKGTYHYRMRAGAMRTEVALYGSWPEVLESYAYQIDKASRPDAQLSITPDQLYINTDLLTICRRYLAEYVRPKLARMTYDHYEAFLDRLLTHMKSKPAFHGRGTVFETQHEIRLLLKHIRDVEKKPVLCNRMKSSYSSMFKWALEETLVTQNPIHSMPSGQETAKTCRLSDRELTSWLRALKSGQFKEVTKDALQLVLLTGMRSGEVRHITPNMLDLDKSELLLPKELTKNRREHLIPLSAKARVILKRNLPGKHPNGAIFPISPWGLRQVCIRACKRAEVTKCSPHDLRRTFATMCGSLGFDTYLIGKLLNHAAVGVTERHYALYEYQREKREAMDAMGSHFTKLEGVV